jgi:LuxR family maltose regulon positive regulatory protein
LHLLDRLHVAAEADGRMGDIVEIQLLRALALQAQGNLPAALTALARALTLAAPEGYVRVFVDEGAPIRLLIADCRLQITQRIRSAAGQDEHRLLAYMDTLLAAFPDFRLQILDFRLTGGEDNQKSKIKNQKSDLVEPLSARESEILRLIADGHSNQAIADRLVVAVSTIKKHVNNIYGKLDVQSRTQALLRARELHLL